jgi:hypothetical protein
MVMATTAKNARTKILVPAASQKVAQSFKEIIPKPSSAIGSFDPP